MLNAIRRLMDVERLSRELTEAQAEIDHLRQRLKAEAGKPAFQQVAKDFDATPYQRLIQDRVVEDLSAILRQDAIDMLCTAFKEIRRAESEGARGMSGLVAYDYHHNRFVFRFETRAAGTTVECVHMGGGVGFVGRQVW